MPTTDLPSTIEELIKTQAVPNNDHRIRCGICMEPYGGSFESETPIELSCNHIFGQRCLTDWLRQGQNSCPVCRHPFLNLPAPTDPEDLTEEEHQRLRLLHWHLHPNAYAVRGEELFATLCEHIVRYIEDPTINDALIWLEREPFREIINWATFENFMDVVIGPACQKQMMLDDLEELLPQPGKGVLREAKSHAEGSRNEHEFLAMDPFEGDEHSYERMREWARRVRESRDRLYGRLYGRAVEADGGGRRLRSE